jgi:VanZ family protein
MRRILTMLMSTRAPWLSLWLLATVTTAVLYLLPDAGPPGYAQLDKVTHVIAFGAIGLPIWPGTRRLRPFAWVLLLSLTLAATLEWPQSFVPGRDFSMLDSVANLVGLGTGTAASLYLKTLIGRSGPLRYPT